MNVIGEVGPPKSLVDHSVYSVPESFHTTITTPVLLYPLLSVTIYSKCALTPESLSMVAIVCVPEVKEPTSALCDFSAPYSVNNLVELLYVNPDSAIAPLAVPSEVKTLVKLGSVTAVNPVPLVPDEPLEPEVPLVPEEPDVPLEPELLLVQGLEANDGVAFFTGGVVHEETYLSNAEELLSQVQSLDDLMYVLQRLQWDSDLFGRDKLDKVETEIETAWGVALQQVTYDGEVYVTYQNPNTNGAVQYVKANVLISTTGTVTDYIKIGEEIDYTIWTGTLTNMTKTLGLSNGDLITAESNTGSLGANTDYAQGGYHRVEEVLSDTSIKFRTIGGSVPIVGNVANVTLHTLLPGEPYGVVAEAIYYNTMSSSDSSPSIGSLPGGGGGSGGGGKGGGMGNLFGKSSGIMQDMWKRLSQGGEKEAKQMHQKLNQSKFPQTAAEVAKKTKNGSSPLELITKALGSGE